MHRYWLKSTTSRQTIMVVIPTLAVVADPDHVCALARELVSMKLSRRGVARYVVEALSEFSGTFIHHDGKPFQIPEFDQITDLPHCAWEMSFLRCAYRRPTRAPQSRVLERIRAIDMSMRVKDPDAYARVRRMARQYGARAPEAPGRSNNQETEPTGTGESSGL